MKKQEETITVTRSKLEKIYYSWCHECMEYPDNFESIKVNEMTEEEIDQYSKDCADYMIKKCQES